MCVCVEWGCLLHITKSCSFGIMLFLDEILPLPKIIFVYYFVLLCRCTRTSC